MADHNDRVTPDPGLVPAERPQHAPAAHRPPGAVAIGESPNHESSAVELRPIVTTTVAILLIVVLSDLVLYGLYKFWQARHDTEDKPETPLLLIRPEMADPKLQVDEHSALENHLEADRKPLEGYKWVEPGKVATVPVEQAIDKIAAAGALPTGPEWSLRPDERMVGGVILNPAQVQYANTPPSQALVGQPGAAPSAGQVGTAPPDVVVPASAAATTSAASAPQQAPPRSGAAKPKAEPAAPRPAGGEPSAPKSPQ